MTLQSYNFSQAFLQRKAGFPNLVLSNKTKKYKNYIESFGLKGGKLFELIKSLYELSNARNYCNHTIHKHLLDDTITTLLGKDTTSVIKVGPKIAIEITGIYSDDLSIH